MKKFLIIAAVVLSTPTVAACVIAGMVAYQEMKFNREIDKIDYPLVDVDDNDSA